MTRRGALIALGLVLSACGGDDDNDSLSDAGGEQVAPDVTGDAPAGDGDLSSALPAECADAAVPPSSLVCTGLYADIASKQIGDQIRSYAPAVPLWSDGAHKERWVWLPPGAVIDATNPNEWIFPIGTKFWKEFSRDGRRIETRLWQKVRVNFWVDATYAWNADETQATRSAGGDIAWGDGGTYHIPTGAECDKCHRGRTENILGFEQVGLGLPGAIGVTLADLVSEGRITPEPTSTSLSIGDDGTQAAGPALAWLHVNCGVTCHNRNSNSTAYGAGMRLRLDPTQLDGRPVNEFDPLKTTMGVTVNAPAWDGQTRIVPGDLAHSLLYSLISHRGPNVQMPPIASSVVDEPDVALVAAWIRAMPSQGAPDAAADATHGDAATEAGVVEASVVDASVVDASAVDASVVDAGAVDASIDDISADGAPPDLDAMSADAAADVAVDAGGPSADASNDAGAASAEPADDEPDGAGDASNAADSRTTEDVEGSQPDVDGDDVVNSTEGDEAGEGP